MFNVSFRTKGSSFGETGDLETARLLRKIADEVESGNRQENIYDMNGNKIGIWYFN